MKIHSAIKTILSVLAIAGLCATATPATAQVATDQAPATEQADEEAVAVAKAVLIVAELVVAGSNPTKEDLSFLEVTRLLTESVPILGPLTSGGPAVALDPPSDDEVIRAMERARNLEGGLPLLHETQWNNVRIVKKRIADYVDPLRFYPLMGPAQLHHAHYKCTAYFSETTHVGWPLPITLTNEDAVEVIYIDHIHLHRVSNTDAVSVPDGGTVLIGSGIKLRPATFTNLGNGVGVPTGAIDDYAEKYGISRDEAKKRMLAESNQERK